MSLLYKDLNLISEDDLIWLKNNKVKEALEIDYKQDFPNLGEEKAKSEFLKDICAFANAAGGDIIFGIEGKSYPTDIVGIEFGGPNALDSELNRVTNIIASNFEPRLPLGIRTKVVSLANGKDVLILRVLKSWLSPHRIKLGNKFVVRRLATNLEMTIDEIRASFILSEGLQNRLRSFRFERLAAIETEDTPIELAESPKLVVHVIPVEAFNSLTYATLPIGEGRNFRTLTDVPGSLKLLRNFDGMCLYLPSSNPEESLPVSYCQIYNNGVLEMVDVSLINVYGTIPRPRNTNSDNKIKSDYEIGVIKILHHNIKSLERLGFAAPFLIFIGLLGVQGFRVYPHGRSSRSIIPSYDMFKPIRNKNLIIREIEITATPNKPQELALLLKPAFDSIWNASGVEKSINYDDTGNFLYEDELTK
jgi:hypothetical protein